MAGGLAIHFEGPFSWPGTPDAPSVFDVEAGRNAGIYLWTVPIKDGHLVYYVGETARNFRDRLAEHYREHAACMYHVYSPAEFSRGEKRPLWPGHYDSADRKSLRECIAQYKRLAVPVGELSYLYKFFLARTICDDRIRIRIEAAIASAIYAAPGVAGTFQDSGIHYDPRRGDEDPLECSIMSSAPIIGLPTQLSV
jgi:hypothetical protein